MNEQRMRTALGFSMRAGKCLSGDFVCERAVKDGRAKIVALDSGASQSTRERYQGMCDRAGIPLVMIDNLGNAIGKDNRMIAAVTDNGFANMMREAMKS